MMNPIMQQQVIPNPYGLSQQAPPTTNLLQGRNYPTLYVGNLEEQITEEMLYKFFYRYGNIYSIRVMRDRTMKTSRGFAYVSFYQLKDAESARVNANHEKILKQELRVTWKKNLKEINKEANIIVKNLDESVTGQTLEQEFSQFGSIFSSIVCYDTNGKSRGYGYVQFDTVEIAQKCIQQSLKDKLKIKDKEVEVQVFQQKTNRLDQRKNLYFKNLPSATKFTKEQVKQLLDQECSKFGAIESSVVELQGASQKFFAFVSFKEKEAAENCQKTLKDSDPFGTQESLYVEWHESKQTRQKQLKQQYSNSTNETNLYTKFLKQDVTQEELKKQFEQYGVITSCIIRKPDPNSAYAQKNAEKLNTNFGYINFSDKENAKKAIEDAKKNSEIIKLYDKSVYLTYLIKKEQFNHFKDAKFRHKKHPYPQVVFDPFIFNPFMMQQFNPMMMGKQFNAAARPPFMQGFNPLMAGGMMPQQYAGPQQNQQQRYNNPQAQNKQFNNPNQRQYSQPQQKPKQGKQANYTQNRGVNQRSAQFGNQAGATRTVNQQRPQPQMQNGAAQPLKFTPQNLKENLSQFLQLQKEEQRSNLGELLYPSVVKYAKQQDLAPKITGMLIDFEVFEIQEIIELLENEENLKERVVEAEELIIQGGDN